MLGNQGWGNHPYLMLSTLNLSIKTNEISTHLGRGKHTTRHVELIAIEMVYVADTPGFSSLEFTDIEAEDLPNCFPEMAKVEREL